MPQLVRKLKFAITINCIQDNEAFFNARFARSLLNMPLGSLEYLYNLHCPTSFSALRTVPPVGAMQVV